MHEDLSYTFTDSSLNPTLYPSSTLAGVGSDKHASFNTRTSALMASMNFSNSAGVFCSNLAASPHDARIFSLYFRIYIGQYEDSMGVRINPLNQ